MQYSFGVIVPGAVVSALGQTPVLVRLCGSLPELGSWTVESAPRLTLRTQEFYEHVALVNEPRFYRVDIQLPSDLAEFQYKYVINDDLWEGNKTDSRRWTRDNATNLGDDVYYTPIDSWIKANCTSKSRCERIRRSYPYGFSERRAPAHEQFLQGSHRPSNHSLRAR